MKTRCTTLVSNTLEYAEVLEVVREAEVPKGKWGKTREEYDKERKIQRGKKR